MVAPIRRAAQIVAVLLLAGLVGLFFKSLIDNGTTVAALVADGKHPAAPAITLEKLDGSGTMSLAGLRGKLVVLNFWASWCGPCKDEAPLLEQISVQYRDQGVVVLGIDSQDATSDGRKFAAKYGLTYPLLHTAGSDLSHRWGVTGYPETFLLDRQGRVVHHFPGAVSGGDVTGALKSLLGPQAP
ncbi:MAG: cytochrome c biosis protein CcmG, thiol:disulfide interchange protein DsbE [Gaiellales bacterium]|nr:cytochrome c biosis protein CcmG, thiol:disulfide interchange protein DsbE [Gaiellales bacterium]